MFSTVGLTDQLSQACVQPGYADEVLRWRAVLRPFLYPGGSLGKERPLESMSSGVEMAALASDIVAEGLRRQAALCAKFLSHDRFVESSREDTVPVLLTGEEERYHADDMNKPIRQLRAEIEDLLCVLPGSVEKEKLKVDFHGAKRRAEFVDCLRTLRRVCISVAQAVLVADK